MPSEKRIGITRLSIVIGLVAIVLLLVTFFFTGEDGLLRTQILLPFAEKADVSDATGFCGPIRKIDYVDLAEVTRNLQTCTAQQQRQCRAEGKTFAAAENVRFGKAYPDHSQDVYWDYVCY